MATRYMDDILAISLEEEGKEFRQQMDQQGIYHPPLELEDGGSTIFLQTEIIVEDGRRIKYRLKNENMHQRRVWRYHNYESDLKYNVKRAVLLGVLQMVHKMASDDGQLFISAKSKIEEFINLGYPSGILRFLCAIMARDTGNITWRRLRSLM